MIKADYLLTIITTVSIGEDGKKQLNESELVGRHTVKEIKEKNF